MAQIYLHPRELEDEFQPELCFVETDEEHMHNDEIFVEGDGLKHFGATELVSLRIDPFSLAAITAIGNEHHLNRSEAIRAAIHLMVETAEGELHRIDHNLQLPFGGVGGSAPYASPSPPGRASPPGRTLGPSANDADSLPPAKPKKNGGASC